MENLLRQAPAIKGQGTFFGPFAADRKLPPCATRDIAAVAAQLLVDRSWTGRADVPVLGPEDLSCDDMARTMSDVLDRPIRYQRVPFDALEAQLKGQGMSDAFVRAYVDMMRAKDEGMDNAEPRTDRGDHAHHLTGLVRGRPQARRGRLNGERATERAAMKTLVRVLGLPGSFFSDRFHDAGHDISLLARGERLTALREHGVLLAEKE